MSARKVKTKNPSIETFNGDLFYYRDPVFDIRDIAWALSGMERFAARSRTHYSVANHSTLVARIVLFLMKQDKMDGNPRQALVHDFTEAYWLDMPSPPKGLLLDYKKEEKTTWKQIAAWAQVPVKLLPSTEYADALALFLEADILMPSKGKIYQGYAEYRDMVVRLKQNGITPKLTTRNQGYEDLLLWWKKSESHII